MSKLKTIPEQLCEHPLALMFHGSNDCWYSVRPYKDKGYWLESDTGEGTEVDQDLLYTMLDILFKKVF